MVPRCLAAARGHAVVRWAHEEAAVQEALDSTLDCNKYRCDISCAAVHGNLQVDE